MVINKPPQILYPYPSVGPPSPQVRCLRRWLREMEARIDPLQFGGVEGWSTGDRERKMAEYQVGRVGYHMVW